MGAWGTSSNDNDTVADYFIDFEKLIDEKIDEKIEKLEENNSEFDYYNFISEILNEKLKEFPDYFWNCCRIIFKKMSSFSDKIGIILEIIKKLNATKI